jgi:GT2 family glycosyltransferase
MPDISVQIVTCNSAATIDPCLNALAAQQSESPDVRIDVHVIDNASSDDSVARVQQHGHHVTVNSQNVGYAAAHNQALALSDSRYVLTLNPDVQLEPGFLAAMVATLDADPKCGSAAGCLLRVDALGDEPYCIDGAGLYMRRNRRQGLRYEKEPVAERPLEQAPIFGPDGAAAFYRRAMLDDISVEGEVFDTDFFLHKEDIDVCWRAQLRGWGSVYVPDAVAHHIRGFRPGVRANVSADLRFYGTRNRYLLMLKNEMPGRFLRDLWRIALYDLGIAAYILLRERDTARVYPSLIALTRRMLRKRRIIQRGRRASSAEVYRWFV